jgi:hypothetical protein
MRSSPLNVDLLFAADVADVFVALHRLLPPQSVVSRRQPSKPRVPWSLFLLDRRVQVVKARF